MYGTYADVQYCIFAILSFSILNQLLFKFVSKYSIIVISNAILATVMMIFLESQGVQLFWWIKYFKLIL